MIVWLGCPLNEPPAGSRCSQAFEAALTCALLTAPSALMTPALGIPPLLAGSGKFGTPCERIQEEYATSPVESVLPPADELAAVVVVEPVAALGVDGPPPQAATATPTARIPAVTNAARRNRGRRLGSR